MRYKEKGFTIIEMMIVISLITVLSTFVFISYWSVEYDLAFERKMAESLQNIGKARDYAIASWYPEEFEGGVFQGGYGVNFITGRGEYVLFADLENEEVFTNNSKVIENLNLEEGMIVENVTINGVSGDSLSIVFRSPDLFVFFNGVDAIENDIEAVIFFGSEAVDYTKEIKINLYGVPTYEK